MSDSPTRVLRQHVETWRRADAELSRLKQQELQNVDTRKAVWQMFGENTLVQDAPKLRDSGLVEQQAWFAKLRKIRPAG
ncbi:MAG: hypothetical protein JNN08_13235 [Bryobacterales bacterium]|nr:hypothetical protein [Bryobacterales bacterium]